MDPGRSHLPVRADVLSVHPPALAATFSFAEHVHAFHEEAGQVQPSGAEKFSETMSRWLALQYMAAAHRASQEAGEAGLPLETLHDLSVHMTGLRAGDHSLERLRLMRERNDILGKLTAERMEKDFERWLKRPEVMKRFQKEKLSPEEKERRIKAVFGITA
jgi:hypothetical protein